MSERDRHVETRVPPGEAPAATCPHCDRPFTRERLRDLHVVESHPAAATPTEREAHEAALDAETDELFVYHLKVVGALVGTFFLFTYTYAFVLS